MKKTPKSKKSFSAMVTTLVPFFIIVYFFFAFYICLLKAVHVEVWIFKVGEKKYLGDREVNTNRTFIVVTRIKHCGHLEH